MSAGALPLPLPTRGRGLLPAGARWTAATVVLGPLAALGAVAFPGPSAAVGATSALVAGALVRSLHRAAVPGSPSLPGPAAAAVSAALLPAAVAGTAVLGLLPVGLVAGGLAPALAAGWWLGSVPEPSPAPPGAAREPDEESLCRLLRSLPIDVLFEEWGDVVGRVPPGTGDDGAREVQRRLLVAELRRRDPAGTSRWLSEAPGAPPDGYVRDTGDAPT